MSSKAPSSHPINRPSCAATPTIGVVASVPGEPDGFIRLLVVDPAHRGKGHGDTLLTAARADLAASRVITVGADAPYFLFPGVETSEIAMLCLLEKHRFTREEANFNMEVDLTRIPPDPGGPALATALDRDELADWMTVHWAHWRPEVLRALDQGTLLLARRLRDRRVLRMEREPARLARPHREPTEPGREGNRAAAAPRRAAPHPRLGASTTEICWVGPIRPYAAIGGRITRMFFVYRKRRRPPKAPSPR